jgi:Leucine-rich repeat (LRR) protein
MNRELSSQQSQGSQSSDRKRREKDRAVERRLKHELQTDNVEIGRIVVVDKNDNTNNDGRGGGGANHAANDDDDNDADDTDVDNNNNDEEIPQTRSFNFPESRQSFAVAGGTSGDPHRYPRGGGGYTLPGGGVSSGSLIFPSAPCSTGSKQPSSDLSHRNNSSSGACEMSIGSVSAILNSEINKSSSLIFPIGVSSNGHHDGNLEAWKSNAINHRVNLCEKRKFLKKNKELLLDDLKLTADDIPLQLLNETTLGNTLYKLTLRGNRLKAVPDKLVQCLPALRVLDLQQCDLRTLPKHWNLPRLATLDLSHNLLICFPEDVGISCGVFRALSLYLSSRFFCYDDWM